jgi:hypothetical protein
MPESGQWLVHTEGAESSADKQLRVTVGCVNYNNFVYLNGGTVIPADEQSTNVYWPPWLNGGGGYLSPVGSPGQLVLLSGWEPYLSEPQTQISVGLRRPTSQPTVYAKDVFPFLSTGVRHSVFTIDGSNGGGAPLLNRTEQGSPLAETTFGSRDTSGASRDLEENGFCYLTGVSGKFFNVNDSVLIDTSDGFSTLKSNTITSRDRNPGGYAQCLRYDLP